MNIIVMATVIMTKAVLMIIIASNDDYHDDVALAGWLAIQVYTKQIVECGLARCSTMVLFI